MPFVLRSFRRPPYYQNETPLLASHHRSERAHAIACCMCRRHLMVVSPRVFPLCEKLGLWNNFIPRFSSDTGLASPLQNRRGREMCTSSRRYPTLQAVNRISWNKFRRIEAYARGSQSSANSSHRNPPHPAFPIATQSGLDVQSTML